VYLIWIPRDKMPCTPTVHNAEINLVYKRSDAFDKMTYDELLKEADGNVFGLLPEVNYATLRTMAIAYIACYHLAYIFPKE